MIKKICTLLCFVGIIVPLSGESDFDPYLGQMARAYNIDGNGSYESRIWIEPIEGGYVFHTQSDAYSWSVQTDYAFQVQSSSASYSDSNYAELAKMEGFQLIQITEGSYHCSRTNTSGRTRTVESDMTNALDITMVRFILQREFQENNGPIALEQELYDPARLSSYRISLVSTEMDMLEILEHQDDFDFPEDWKIRLGRSQDVILVEGNLMGVPGVVYPHDFNYLLDSDYRVLMEWGGAPGKEYYAFFEYEPLP